MGRADLTKPTTQVIFAELAGVAQQAVSEFIAQAAPCAPAREMLSAYCARLQGLADGGEADDAGGFDLVQERAALAREMREGHRIKNEVARKTYAPITLLAETLAMASQAVVERFDQLPATLKKTCPELPEAARDQVVSVIAAARNEWVGRTLQLLSEHLEAAQAAEERAEP